MVENESGTTDTLKEEGLKEDMSEVEKMEDKLQE